MPDKERDRTQENATYVTLIAVFLSAFAAIAMRKRTERYEIKPFDLALLGLATFRAGHLVSYDKVTEPLRQPVTKTVPDESGQGKTVEAEGTGIQRALGELVACPTCIGTWGAAVMVYGLYFLPGPTRLMLAILGATGAAELIDSLAEALKQTANAARNLAG